MPKELIHFTVAERTAQRLSNTRYGPSLRAQEDSLLLGSVLHDALFYAVTPSSLKLEPLAHMFHGAKGEDTYELIRLQTRHASSAQDKDLPVALLVGIVSHLFADIVMHPMVYHFTGDYYAATPKAKTVSRQRHRALEALMDMVACPTRIGKARYRLRYLVRRTPDLTSKGLPVKDLGLMANMTPDDIVQHFAEGWRVFSILQTLFPIQWLAKSLFGLRRFSPKYVAEVACLFYAPQLMDQADFLSGIIKYRHPVTGKALQASLDGLMDSAANQAAAFCLKLEEAVFEQTEPDLPDTGPSMDAGLSGVTSSDMTHFAPVPFPHLA